MARRGAVLPALLNGVLIACSGGSDDAPPAAPRNVVAGASSSTTVEVAWSPSTDDQGVVWYLVYRGGQQLDPIPGETAFTDTGLTPSTRYCYAVVAVDFAGQRSPSSLKACATTATPHPITVVKSGTGTGTVASSLAGIDCGGTCKASFDAGSWVTLTAIPGSGSLFSGWQGCTSASGTTCTVHVMDPKTVTADFILKPHLTVLREGPGSGAIVSSPAGIDCGSTCVAPFDPGSSVTLTPIPGSGSLFTGWEGCTSASLTTCTVLMAAPTTVTATFVATGGVRVTTATSGPAPDPDGFRLELAGADRAEILSLPVPVVGTTTMGNLLPGPYRASLWEVAPNCHVSPAWVILDVVGGETVDLAFDVTCSPDRGLAFVSDATGHPQIYSARWDGTGLRRLTDGPAASHDLVWSPDGSRVAFISDRDGNPEIYVMNADGSSQTRLTTEPANDHSPSWSPDGVWIAFVSERDGNAEIYAMSADGSSQTRLTAEPAGNHSPAWSPDGTRIAFVSERDGNAEIYVMSADGSNQARLTADAASDHSPAWSPDGSRIAFVRQAVNRRDGSQVHVMSADGSASTALPRNRSTSDVGRPAWSPSGTRIAFGESGPAGIWAEWIGVAVVNADGTGLSWVIANLDYTRYCGFYGSPAWSPNGRHLAFVSGDNGGCMGDSYTEIAVMEVGAWGRGNWSHAFLWEYSPYAPAWRP